MLKFFFLYLFVLLRVATYFVTFIADVVLLTGYITVWLLLTRSTSSADDILNNLVDRDTLSLHVPFMIIVVYIVLTLGIYRALYRKVTSYHRWMYAVRTIFILLLPVAFLLAIAVAAFKGYDGVMSDLQIGVVLVPVLMLVAWTIYGISSFLSEGVSLLNPQNTSHKVTKETFMTPRKVISILFSKEPEFVRPPKRNRFRSPRRPT